MRISLTGPQWDFVHCPAQFPALVAGFGAGKTHAAVWRAIDRKLRYPKQSVAYYLPTYDLVRTICFPRFAEVLDTTGLPYKVNKTAAEIDIAGMGTILFRTMDTPERIVGFEVADSLVDELDTLPTDKARDVWNKIIARNRQKKPDGSLNTVAVATTPEGFRFVWERWVRDPAPGYEIIKATTLSNAKNLPQGYVDSLRNTYPEALLAAYTDGEFVNLTAGSVYASFNRARCATFETISPDEQLHVGMDFNVSQMAAVVCVQRQGKLLALDELTGVFDTPAMIALLKQRFPGRRIYVYPDASGGGRKTTDASVSDLALLRQAGFSVLANAANPAVRDRVLAVNRALERSEVLVNPDRCPSLVEALEKQAYTKNGEPDKTGGLDHVIDAAGYCIAYKFPVVRQSASRLQVVGL